LLLGVIVSSEYPPRLIGSVVGRRRALGAHGRSAGLADEPRDVPNVVG
jgi:hypothetical protein